MISAIEHFLSWLLDEKGYSRHTVEGYRHDILEFSRFCGNPGDPAPIDGTMVRSFVGSLYAVNSSASVARKLSALRTFFRYLLRNRRVTSDPLVGIVGPKLNRSIPSFLTVDEVFSLLEAPVMTDRYCRRDRAIMEVLYSTGMRVSELVGGNLTDYDIAAGMVRVRGKGNKERVIPFGRAAAEAIQQYLSERESLIIARLNRGLEAEREALFLNGRGTRLTARSVERFLESIRPARRHRGAGHPARPAAFLCHPPARNGSGPAHRPGTARTCESVDHPEVYPPQHRPSHQGL